MCIIGNMLWTWVCMLISAVIVLIGYEIVLTPHVLQGQVNRSLCVNISKFNKDHNNTTVNNRLVIFLVDGMRDDTADPRWISRIVDGNYGRGRAIAARPMTRPGLVAIFSGHYEDVFALLPIFSYRTAMDSIFHYADYTFYFGPTETRTYFKDGNQWISRTYPTKWLDLQGRSDLPDDHVFDNIQEMFNKPKEAMNYRNIFFIHLSGVDLAGHVARRGTRLLEDAVDKMGTIINKTVALFDNHFQDRNSAYVILSDHGMTDWGTHGDSLAQEVITPVVLWGSGLATGYQPTIKQVDLCPLLASILGTPVPYESIGTLHNSYLNTTNRSLAFSNMCTAVQLANLCQTTWQQIDNGFLIKHILTKTMPACKYDRYIRKLTKLMRDENYAALMEASENTTKIAQHCLANVQNFYKTSYLFILIMSYFAWIFGTICMLSVASSTVDNCLKSCAGKVFTIATCLGYILMTVFSISSVILEHMPNYVILFILVPSLAWMMTTMRTGVCLTKLMKTNQCTLFLYTFAILAMAEYTYWSKYFPFLFAVYLLPYASMLTAMNHKFVPRHVPVIWIATSVALVFSPLLPALGLPKSAVLLNVASAIWIVGCSFFAYALNLKAKECLLTLGFTSIICLSTWIIDLNYLGSNLVLKILAWAVLPLPLLTLFASSNLAECLLQVVISMAGPYLLLSTRHEPLVLLVMCLNLYCLLRLEASSPQYDGQIFVRGLTLHYYIILGVFASGNLPYISSFDITWTRLFTTVLDDMIMGSLIAYKLTLFLTVIACFFSATCYYIGTGTRQMIFVCILISAISSARHSVGIIVSKDPITALSEFILGNVLFIITIIPLNLGTLLVNVKNIHD